MPLYEYQCKKCKHRFEKIQRFADRPIKKCPECGGGVEKLLSPPAVQFKGTGWYVTDYAGKNSSSSETSGSSENAGTAAKAAAADGSEKTESRKTDKADNKADKKTPKK